MCNELIKILCSLCYSSSNNECKWFQFQKIAQTRIWLFFLSFCSFLSGCARCFLLFVTGENIQNSKMTRRSPKKNCKRNKYFKYWAKCIIQINRRSVFGVGFRDDTSYFKLSFTWNICKCSEKKKEIINITWEINSERTRCTGRIQVKYAFLESSSLFHHCRDDSVLLFVGSLVRFHW